MTAKASSRSTSRARAKSSPRVADSDALDYFKLVFQASPSAMFVVDENGYIEMANLQSALSFGFTADQFVGMSIDQLVPTEVRTKHAALRKEFLDKPIHRPMGSGRDLEAVCKNGTKIPVEVALSPIHTSHGPKVLASVVDISRRKDAEDRLQSVNENLERLVSQRTTTLEILNSKLKEEVQMRRRSEEKVRIMAETSKAQAQMLEVVFSAIPDHIYHIDRQMVYQFASQSGLNALGLASNDVVGKTWRELGFPPEIMEPFERQVGEVFRSGTPAIGNTVFPIAGEDRHYEYHLNPIIVSGEVDSIVCSASDITGRVHRETRIAELNTALSLQAESLKKSNRELESFAYSVSHDLRAPLRYIDGYVGMLVEDASSRLNEKDQRLLNVITQAAKEMSSLIDDLLKYSRIGRQELDVSRIKVTSLVEALRDHLCSIPENKEVVWQIRDLPDCLGDLFMIRIVWQNLMENAAKFKHPDRPQIVHISGWTSNKFCHYKIRDNGIGFEPIYREKIFGVFERLHPKQEYEGTGIGLSNVMRIIERHGGSINADGQEDEFAEFVFSIPKGDQNDSNS